jgi:hypothetical protein
MGPSPYARLSDVQVGSVIACTNCGPRRLQLSGQSPLYQVPVRLCRTTCRRLRRETARYARSSALPRVSASLPTDPICSRATTFLVYLHRSTFPASGRAQNTVTYTLQQLRARARALGTRAAQVRNMSHAPSVRYITADVSCEPRADIIGWDGEYERRD